MSVSILGEVSTSTRKVLRVGVTPYLNVKPLIAGLGTSTVGRLDGNTPKSDGCPAGIELHFAVPSQLPDLLSKGELDVSLIPSIEYLRGRPLFVIPGVSIASRGAVKSVLLFLKVPRVSDIKRVALDESSLTSATLVRIILQERYGLKLSDVEYVPLNSKSQLPNPKIGHLSLVIGNCSQADAVLVIGDNAMKIAANESGIATIDLGAEWKTLTGLPFVYALWVTSREGLIYSAKRLLHQVKKLGLARLNEIAQKEAKRLGLEPGFCLQYLSENIHYELGEEEIAGLRRFYHYALSMGLASEGVNFDFRSKSHIREGTFQRQ